MFNPKNLLLAALGAFLATTMAFAGEDCSREISLKKHPFSAPQEWVVGKNFTIPEGKSKFYFAGGDVGTKLDAKAAVDCVLAAKAPHESPREFRTHQGEIGSDGKPVSPRTIQVAKLEYGLKKETATGNCCELSCRGLVLEYRKEGFKVKERYSNWSKSRRCSVEYFTFEKWIPDPTVLNFIANDDKTISKITCKNVKTYDQLKNILGDYIQGVKCPDIETEEASIQKNHSVDEDVAVKPSTTDDGTSDAGETKKPTQEKSSGQTTN